VGILKSGTRLEGGGTYELVAKRYNQDGLLQINGGEEEIRGSSPGTTKSLNLKNGGFLGGVPINSSRLEINKSVPHSFIFISHAFMVHFDSHFLRVWESVGTSAGFVGCIHKLMVGRRPVEFDQHKETLLNTFHGVYQCFPQAPLTFLPQPEVPFALAVSVSRNSCLSSPCQNSGECWPESVHGFRCICHPQFSGKERSCFGKLENQNDISQFPSLCS